ncbi:DUF6335 family protein [Nodosilinea nodulosa]|uniref:DUF6335 family protein n=1 Tax=Nodosilinea nodulosa TaxID=416001 RepID=UPI0002D7972C|nr:DUF6335 family protein [Nodosilinea nodulosa]
MNPKQSAAEPSRTPAADMAPPPANGEVIHLPPSQAAIEAARTGREESSDRLGAEVPTSSYAEAEQPLTAGDADAIAARASTVGEEAIGGTTPTPDQNNIDDIGAAVGVSTQPEHPVGVLNKMNRRDDNRFELDPDSKDPQ